VNGVRDKLGRLNAPNVPRAGQAKPHQLPPRNTTTLRERDSYSDQRLTYSRQRHDLRDDLDLAGLPEPLELPREVSASSSFNGLPRSLDKKRLIVLQGVSGPTPKPSSQAATNSHRRCSFGDAPDFRRPSTKGASVDWDTGRVNSAWSWSRVLFVGGPYSASVVFRSCATCITFRRRRSSEMPK
jgi:hypothetical protein